MQHQEHQEGRLHGRWLCGVQLLHASPSFSTATSNFASCGSPLLSRWLCISSCDCVVFALYIWGSPLDICKNSICGIHVLAPPLRSYAVRKAAAIAFGARGAVTSSAHSSANGRGNVSLQGSPADRFLGWALPQLSDVNDNSENAVQALAGLHEFLSTGEPIATERYIPTILRACQALLEDERTSLNLLHTLLGVLAVLAIRFAQIFQPHFADLVDLLLGWALMPDLSESDRCLITDNFLQFQKFWAGNLSFSMSLLTKFLGDMEVLAHDAAPGTPDQLRRLLALALCYVTVLEAMTSGVLELGFENEILGPLQDMLPRLLNCFSTVGQKFKTYKWMNAAFRCLSFFAGLLRERFAHFYDKTIDFLFQSIGLESSSGSVQQKGKSVSSADMPCTCVLTSNQVQALLKDNLQLISLQGPAIFSSAINKLLQAGSCFSGLRLHPSRLVTGVVSATYLALLRHDSEQVVHQAISCLIEELKKLKSHLYALSKKGIGQANTNAFVGNQHVTLISSLLAYSESEVIELVKFDVVVLTCSVCLQPDMRTMKSWSVFMNEADSEVPRLKELRKFVLENLNPFEDPLQSYPDLQFALVQALHMLFRSNFMKRSSVALGGFVETENRFFVSGEKTVVSGESQHSLKVSKAIVIDCLASCRFIIGTALHPYSSLPVKLEALDWLGSLSEMMMAAVKDSSASQILNSSLSEQDSEDIQGSNLAGGNAYLGKSILYSLLTAASDRDQKVRGRVAVVLELLLQARLIAAFDLQSVANTALEQLGDPEPVIQAAFRRLTAFVAPAALWTSRWTTGTGLNWISHSIGSATTDYRKCRHWKQVFALKQFAQHLRPQQLVCVLSYIAQRWQVLPSSWLQRLVHNFPGNPRVSTKMVEEGPLITQNPSQAKSSKMESTNLDLNVDYEMLEKVCTSNNLAAAWWCIHEAARHCVTVRLRTHLGGPTQTFALLERMLLDVVQLLQTDNGQRESAITMSSSNIQLLPMRLLLEFVEALKKNIYNAYEGSVVLSAPLPPSVHFFRANRKVCEEWFARICEALVNASLALQCHAGTYHHAVSRLQDLRSAAASAMRDLPWTSMNDNVPNLKVKIRHDVLRTLRHGSLALCRAHEAETIVGLQVWASSTFGSLLVEDGLSLQKASSPSGPLGWMTGLALQAKGQYERATTHLAQLLQSEEALSAMGADGVQFTISRIIESYVALGDWDSLDCWLQELHALRAKHAGKGYAGALTTAGNDMNAIHALARFDAGDVHGAWGYLDLTPQSSSDLTADPRQALQRSEQMLLQAMLRSDIVKDENVAREIETARAMLEEALLVSGIDGLIDAAPLAMQLHCIKAFEAKCSVAAQKEGNLSTLPFLRSLNSLQEVVGHSLDAMHQDCSLWLKFLRVYRTVLPDSQVTLQLQQQLVRLARKQHNYKLAHRLLKEALVTESTGFQTTAIKCRHGDFLTGFEYERMLLLYAEDKEEEAITELWNVVRWYISSNSVSSPVTGKTKKVTKARACLKLSSWLKQGSSFSLLSDSLSGLHLEKCNDDKDGISVSVDEDDHDETINLFPVDSLEDVVGAAVKTATLLCPDMAKSWFAYASWCYDNAKASLCGSAKVKESFMFLDKLDTESSLNSSSFNEKEVENVYTIVTDAVVALSSMKLVKSESDFCEDSEVHTRREGANSSDIIAKHIIYLMQMAAGACGGEDSDGESPAILLSVKLQQELMALNPTASTSHVTMFVNKLMEIWWGLRRRRVFLYGEAVQGFLKYLSLSNRKNQAGAKNTEFVIGGLKQEREDLVLSASLYVLRILLNHGVELESMIQKGLSSVPPMPWQEITAQLFARLTSHPESIVRKQLEGLLMTLANLSPWAIVYPTLVDLNACEGEPAEELQRILGCLVNLHPKLVRDVQLLIGELGAITVLWEEQWLSTLQDLHADVTRRIATLKEEAARVAENTTLSLTEKSRINAAKYSAMMAPIAVALERRLASTSRSPETTHEAWFQEQYGSQLKAAISVFKSPPTSIASLGDVWRPFDTIASSLANHQKKSIVLLSDVAPRLAALSSSDVPIPGLEKQASAFGSEIETESSVLSGIVTVAAFDEQVCILATKTKPKKLAMVGSDGQRYMYLLKGREDLRLDARVMQLLQAVNGMLRARGRARGRCLAARHYSVTPISGRAGLIQWVENLTSMYAVYKAWQQRNQAAQVAAGAGAVNANLSVPPAVPRPSDMFYGKIIPALKEKGLRKVISRRDWPQEVKRKVLLELMKETPRQLLYREIWCASEGFTVFSSKLQRFSSSVAVMSMVGHILGLGDRHLDNILMDFSTGDVVHIDYNVCFDKGLRLKIPEIVPFRLTPTIQAALGLTGIEGAFRANCEEVLETLQKNKDLILMLLEVFVWDPLVEWTRGDGLDEATIGGEERKGMELAVSLSLFASRVQEIRVPLQEHHDQLLATLPTAASLLQELAESLEHHERARVIFLRSEQERFNAGRAEAAARSFLTEISAVLETAKIAFESQAREFSQAKGLVTEAAREATQWVEQHNRVLEVLRSTSIPEVQAIGQLSSPPEALSLTSAVLAAGVPLTIVPEPAQLHCREVDKEVAQLTAARHEGLLLAANTLKVYSLALQRLLPASYIATSHVHSWAQILQLCASQLSPEVLTAARMQAAELVALHHPEEEESIRKRYEDLQLKIEMLWSNARKIQEDCAELESSIDSEAEHKAKDKLLAIFNRHLHPVGQSKKEMEPSSATLVQAKFEDDGPSAESDDKKLKVLAVLRVAAAVVYGEIEEKIAEACSAAMERFVSIPADELVNPVQKWCFPEVKEQVERCVLVSEIMIEVAQMAGQSLATRRSGFLDQTLTVPTDWALSYKACLIGIEKFVSQMVGMALPEVLKAVISLDPAVMDAFGSISQLRGAVDTALEQLSDIESQRAALIELEKSYHERVEDISQRKALLEAAAVSGREHLSWEEAEELASQEEACRTQLEQLHRAWNQRSAQAAALVRKESNVRATLVAAEQRFDSLVAVDREGGLNVSRGKVLLAASASLFSDLEVLDKALPAVNFKMLDSEKYTLNQIDTIGLGFPPFHSIWKAYPILQDRVFFVWKVGMMDILLDSCIRDSTLAIDSSMSLEQFLSQQKSRLELQLHSSLDHYLRERVVPVLLDCLSKERESLISVYNEGDHHVKKEGEAVKRAQRLLLEYCDSHETVRAAKAAASAMKAQAEELKESWQKENLEAAQLEWLHESALSCLTPQGQLATSKSSSVGDKVTNLLSLNRQQLLDNLRSAVASIARATEGLQAFEIDGRSAEEQLDRGMAWACAGTNSGGSSSNRGIPPEFHEHLRRRRQLLWAGQEQATGIVRLCVAVLEFEASREGHLSMQIDPGSGSDVNEGGSWQQAYQNMVCRLEGSCISFTSADQEWQLAQKNLDMASANLSAATEKLRMASVEAESASGELQTTFSSMKDHIVEAAAAISAFCKVIRSHSALTMEAGSMLEEVLAITEGAEGAHDVHSLAQAASVEHNRLMSDLNKVNMLLLPLESTFASALNSVSNLKGLSSFIDGEQKVEITIGQSQILLNSLHVKVREISPVLVATVPDLINSIKQLHAFLTKLARTASSDAGVLHKALEGVGDSQEARSQEAGLATPGLAEELQSPDHVKGFLEQLTDLGENLGDSPLDEDLIFQDEDDCWISPPESGLTSSSETQAQVSAEGSYWLESEVHLNVSSTNWQPSLISEHGQQKVAEDSIPQLRVQEEKLECASPLQAHSQGEVFLGGRNVCVMLPGSGPISDAGSQIHVNKGGSQRHDGFQASLTSNTAIPDSQNNPRVGSLVMSTGASLVGVDLQQIGDFRLGMRQKQPQLVHGKGPMGSHGDLNALAFLPSNMEALARTSRKKNAYAISVLKRVELKLQGHDIDGKRQLTVAEQVDHLLRQATSIDNLCNMYEGWTPWI